MVIKIKKIKLYDYEEYKENAFRKNPRLKEAYDSLEEKYKAISQEIINNMNLVKKDKDI
ncbi:hypothetical protein Marpi_0283 [Marinitoga piezophila KA3]|uniref:Uncharacterized protein n=2 Tax=Marinitoga TaxID=160798 RepID=H2J406_MARPK|nr:hypothetical protein Marpi_0283 [Marinitoga piezophila KA3]